jgi:hypothetical protein
MQRRSVGGKRKDGKGSRKMLIHVVLTCFLKYNLPHLEYLWRYQ